MIRTMHHTCQCGEPGLGGRWRGDGTKPIEEPGGRARAFRRYAEEANFRRIQLQGNGHGVGWKWRGDHKRGADPEYAGSAPTTLMIAGGKRRNWMWEL